VVQICETVEETRRLTRVSASGLMTFTHVSVAAEPDHFFTCFRQVSVEGNMWFRKHNLVLTCAETRGNAPGIWIFDIPVHGIRPKRSREYQVMPQKHVFALFQLTFRSGNKFLPLLFAFYWALSRRYSWSSFVNTGQVNVLWLVFFFRPYHIYDPLREITQI